MRVFASPAEFADAVLRDVCTDWAEIDTARAAVRPLAQPLMGRWTRDEINHLGGSDRVFLVVNEGARSAYSPQIDAVQLRAVPADASKVASSRKGARG